MGGAVGAMCEERSAPIIRQMTKYGQRMVIQKASYPPLAFSDNPVYQQ
jgi:hypothetical protein